MYVSGYEFRPHLAEGPESQQLLDSIFEFLLIQLVEIECPASRLLRRIRCRNLSKITTRCLLDQIMIPISQFPETKSFPGLGIWGCSVDGVFVAEVGHIPSEFSSLPSCNSIDFASVRVKPHRSRTGVLPIFNLRTRVYGLRESLLFSVAPWSCRCHYRRPSCPRCPVLSVEVKSFPLFLSLYKESFAPRTRIKKTFLLLSFNTIRGSNLIVTHWFSTLWTWMSY